MMARGRHSLVLEVEMDHLQYCTDNFVGVESVALLVLNQNQSNKKVLHHPKVLHLIDQSNAPNDLIIIAL